MKTILEPLTIAANVTQATSTRLDHVLVMVGLLYHTFSQSDISDASWTAVLSSLEQHWAKSDQYTFIAVVFFDASFWHHLFIKDNLALSPAGLYLILTHLFKCVFPQVDFRPNDFVHTKEVYLYDKGERVFSLQAMMLQEIEEGVTINVSKIILNMLKYI